MSGSAKVLITGGQGFLGRHLTPMIRESGVKSVSAPGRDFYDLTQPWQARHMLGDIDPDVVIHLADHNGSPRFMHNRPGEVLYRNIAMTMELVEACRLARKPRLVLVSPNCGGPYGFAKKTMQVLAQTYREQYGMDIVGCVMTDAYGPYEPDYGLIAVPIRALLKALANRDRAVRIPGDITGTHELIYGTDAAEAIMLLAIKHAGPDLLEITSGERAGWKTIVEHLADLTGFDGELVYEDAAPVQEPGPQLDPKLATARLGFTATTPLRDGLKRTIAWYRTWFTP